MQRISDPAVVKKNKRFFPNEEKFKRFDIFLSRLLHLGFLEMTKVNLP